MKQPISPAPTRRSAFTLIEVLVALGIAVITLTVATTTVITVLNADRRADARRSTCLARESLSTSLVVTGTSTGLSWRQQGRWTVDEAPVDPKKAPTPVPWSIWTLRSDQDPTAATALARRTEAAAP